MSTLRMTGKPAALQAQRRSRAGQGERRHSAVMPSAARGRKSRPSRPKHRADQHSTSSMANADLAVAGVGAHDTCGYDGLEAATDAQPVFQLGAHHHRALHVKMKWAVTDPGLCSHWRRAASVSARRQPGPGPARQKVQDSSPEVSGQTILTLWRNEARPVVQLDARHHRALRSTTSTEPERGHLGNIRLDLM